MGLQTERGQRPGASTASGRGPPDNFPPRPRVYKKPFEYKKLPPPPAFPVGAGSFGNGLPQTSGGVLDDAVSVVHERLHEG